MTSITLQRLSPAGEHCFFGYYDVPALLPVERHLCHRVPFRERAPGPVDVAELGTLPLDGSACFTPLAETSAWNFQQGSLLQTLGGTDGRFIHNAREPSAPSLPRAVIRDARGAEQRSVSRPVATVSTDGRSALSVSFARLLAFRPGYGYAELVDRTFAESQPAGDGLWLLDLRSGNESLVLSLATLGARLRDLAPEFTGRLLVNHATFNPSSGRFVALVRNFPDPATPRAWRTALVTAARDGSDLRVQGPATYASHYWWRDDATLLCWCDGPCGHQLYAIDDATGAFTVIDGEFFRADGHMSVSPDGRWLLYDSYPDAGGRQHVYLYDLAARCGHAVAQLATAPVPDVDLRCDLHPRWIDGGRRFSIDSTHEGYRAVYLATISA